MLKCRARHPPSGYTVDMRLEWFGPNGPIDVEKDDVVIGEQYSAIHYIQREVVFSYLTPNQNGLYTCQLSAYFEASNETLVEQNQYLLEVLSKFCRCFYIKHFLFYTRLLILVKVRLQVYYAYY